jgi:hypothetical protein
MPNKIDMNAPPAPDAIAPLPRVATWEQWEAGRATRRALSAQICGGGVLRRKAGQPRKDALLRELCGGERGYPFSKN